MEDIDQTTELIKDTLGVSLTISETRNLLIETESALKRQAPYLDARLLFRRDKLKAALGQEERNGI